MQALLLAGGMGSRLRPITEDLPKPMVPLGNRPWLASLILHLRKVGVSRFVLAVKHHAHVIEEYFGDGSSLGVEIRYAREREFLGTAGAMKNAEPYLEDRFLVVNADIVHLVNLERLLAFHAEHGGAVTIGLTEVEDPSAYGVVAQGERGEILRFVEKPKIEEAPSRRINAGVYVLERRVLDAIPRGREVSIEREIFPRLIAEGAGAYGLPLDGYWMDIGTPERYRQAHWDLLDGAYRLPEFPAGAKSGIYAGRRVRIGKNVRLVPPLLLSDDVVVEDDAVVGPYAILGEGVRVGRGATVTRTILWRRARVGELSHLSETIGCEGVETPPAYTVHAAILKVSRERLLALRAAAQVASSASAEEVPPKAVPNR